MLGAEAADDTRDILKLELAAEPHEIEEVIKEKEKDTKEHQGQRGTASGDRQPDKGATTSRGNISDGEDALVIDLHTPDEFGESDQPPSKKMKSVVQRISGRPSDGGRNPHGSPGSGVFISNERLQELLKIEAGLNKKK